MSTIRLWRRELIYLFLLIIVAALLSYFVGYFMHMLVFILLSFIVQQAILMARFEQWLSYGASSRVPKGSGVWTDIYYHFYRIKKNDKQRKKKLGKIIDQFRKITNVLPDATVILDDLNEITWANKLAKPVLGIKKTDKGQRIDNLIRTPEFVAFLKNNNEKKALIQASPVDSNIILQFRIVSYGMGQQLVIAHDVTQQKKIDAMRKNFVDNVSHELRTPLTVLRGYLETLQDMDEMHSLIVSQSLGKMNLQVDRMQYLVDDLLLLAQLETKKKPHKCINLKQLITAICQPNVGTDIQAQRIQLKLESELSILGEEQELQSAFTNLLVNALKYSAENTLVKVKLQKNNGQLIIEIADQGEGIPDKELSRITERFYRVDCKRNKKINGTGLGLAIVKHVLIRHDATLEINSELGKGSTFRCIFPASRRC